MQSDRRTMDRRTGLESLLDLWGVNQGCTTDYGASLQCRLEWRSLLSAIHGRGHRFRRSSVDRGTNLVLGSGGGLCCRLA